ncbi:MAG: thiolase family protein [Ignavibacteriaceae bacterium]|jgi:acetyl-CoA C-acetyltransferase|nr:thiolase family protein [Ignavibacteriaceae bacterium]MCW8812029.1 thiolase family protein [Chlorobium sp.]MCW8994760.1 thiolase family protein [Psychromonas sp.]MCW8817185.1 thiolase family protein [Ignavibacteriaceae bacterium]MCW8822541.1 thiolase family protein [Ignavibacteriaceae bacterium]
MDLNEIVAISAVRTAMGKFGGTLKDLPAYDLGAVAVREAIKKSSIESSQVDDVILGSCRQAGNGPNPARTASVKGGIPESVPVITLNMACPSGMRALAFATQSIRLGEANVVLVGGFDSMSTIPYLLKGARWDGFKMGNKIIEDGWSDSIDPLIGQGMGETAENLFDKYKISREEQDEFAIESHLKASAAQKNGWFDEEIVPIEIPGTHKTPSVLFNKDETIRHEIDKGKMAKIKPAFRKDGTVTAGNACGLSDGATALIITHRKKAEELGVKPLFSIVSYSQVAVGPSTMGEGPALSIPAALEKAGMKLSDMDLIEVNEAFAIQVLANERVLKWDRAKLNVHGGAIALGHPTGISGARIIVTLYHALKRLDKTYGIAGICGGGGVSMATVIRREF